jgi:hypothetical protein
MNAQESIEKIINLLGLKFKKEVFTSTMLKDNTTEVTNNIEDDFAVGQTLYIVQESTLVPAPSGPHETREGLVLTLDEESTIIAITSADAKDDAEIEVESKSKMESEEPSETTVVSEIAEIIEVMTPNEVTTEESAKIAEKIYDEVEKLMDESEGEFGDLEEKITEEIAEIIEVMTPNEVTTEESAKIAEKIVSELNGELTETFKKRKSQKFSKEISSIKESISHLIELVNSMNGKFKTEVTSLKQEFEAFKKSPERKSVEEKKHIKETFADYKLNVIKSALNKK